MLDARHYMSPIPLQVSSYSFLKLNFLLNFTSNKLDYRKEFRRHQMAHLPSFFIASALVAVTRVISVDGTDFAMLTDATEIITDEPIDYRLPSDVVPTSYNMSFAPHLKNNFTFDGKTEIKITVVKQTDKIVLHAYESLIIKSAKLEQLNGKTIEIPLLPPVRNETTDFLMFGSSKLLVLAEYLLSLEFKGEIRNGWTGFYRVRYRDDNGEQR